MLVGLLVFYQPGTLEQLTLGMLLCFLYACLCCYLLPFGTQTDNVTAIVTQFSLFVTMLSAIIIEHGPLETPAAVKSILVTSALLPIMLTLALSIAGALNEIGGWKPLAKVATPIEKSVTRRLSKATGRHDDRIRIDLSHCATEPNIGGLNELMSSQMPDGTLASEDQGSAPASTPPGVRAPQQLQGKMTTADNPLAEVGQGDKGGAASFFAELSDLSDRVKSLLSAGRVGAEADDPREGRADTHTIMNLDEPQPSGRELSA